jgi:hypothetical protein
MQEWFFTNSRNPFCYLAISFVLIIFLRYKCVAATLVKFSTAHWLE